MESKFFRVDGLSSCLHTEQTREIFRQRHPTSTTTSLVTYAIEAEAIELGFVLENGTKPNYISNERYEFIAGRIAKSRGKSYTYLMAFEYLRSIRPGVSKSNIQRDAIVNSS